MQRLDNARLKCERAKHHLNTLKKEVARFLRKKPYTVRKEFDVKQGKYLFRVKIARRLPQEDWGLIIGDCIHNARSALDHLAWELAGSDPNDTKTQFPVFIDRQRFNRQGLPRISRLKPKPRALALVKWLQPYRRPNPPLDPLWLLQTLDVVDKHKLILITQSVLEESSISYKVPPQTRLKYLASIYVGAFKDSAIIADAKVIAAIPEGPAAPPNPKVKVSGDFSFGIAFGEGSAPDNRMIFVLPALTESIRCVEEVIDLFDRLT